MLLANGNGDETIRRNGDAFRSLDVFSPIDRILWDEAKYKRFVCVSGHKSFLNLYKAYQLGKSNLMLLNIPKQEKTRTNRRTQQSGVSGLSQNSGNSRWRSSKHFCGYFCVDFIDPDNLSLHALCFALLAGKGRSKLQTRFPFLLVSIYFFSVAKHLCLNLRLSPFGVCIYHNLWHWTTNYALITVASFYPFLASDCHLGYMEKDQVRGNDSLVTFEEILQIAKEKSVSLLWCKLVWTFSENFGRIYKTLQCKCNYYAKVSLVYKNDGTL